jgi:hypothetical protein
LHACITSLLWTRKPPVPILRIFHLLQQFFIPFTLSNAFDDPFLVEGIEIPAGPPVRVEAQHAEREIVFDWVWRATGGFGAGEVKMSEFDGIEVVEDDAARRGASGCFTWQREEFCAGGGVVRLSFAVHCHVYSRWWI